MKRALIPVFIIVIALVAIAVIVLSTSDPTTPSDFEPSSGSSADEAIVPDAGGGAQGASKAPMVGLPDPTLAEKKTWRQGDMGPPPDGFNTHMVEHEKMFQRIFQKSFADSIELCLDEVRKRGKLLDGNIRFDVAATPRPGLRMHFRVQGAQFRPNDSPAAARGDAGTPPTFVGELPAEVLQCISDTVEGTEVAVPPFAAPLFAIARAPAVQIDYEVREQSPAGPVEIEEETLPVVDAGLPPTSVNDAGL